MSYLGASPLASFASPTKDRFSGNNSDTSFTMSQRAPDANSIEVFVGNVRQEPNVAYTTNGTTLTFTGTPPTGTNNIYVVHKQGVIGNGLLPTSGRSTDRVVNMDIDGDLSGHGQVSGQLLLPVTLNGTDGSSSDAGDNLVLEGTDSSGANANDNILFEGATTDINQVGQIGSAKFQFDNDVLIKGNVRSISSGDAMQLETGTQPDTSSFIILDASASGTDEGGNVLFEDGTGDPAGYFNSGIASFGGEVTSTLITSPTIRKNAASPTFTLPSADGEDGQAIITDASGNLSFGDAGGGKVLQVVHVQKTDVFTTTSSSFTDVTGLTADITPSATSSKVLVMVSVSGQMSQSESNVGKLTIFRGGSDHFTSLLTGSTITNGTFQFTSKAIGADSTTTAFETQNYHIIDSPSTTSQLTYNIKARIGSGTLYIGRVENPDNVSARPRGISTITLMEIGA